MIDRKAFFDAIRARPFGGKITLGQKQGTDAILDEWERRQLTDLRWLAYMLATAKWETAHTMQPIKEHGGAAYFTKMYDVTGSRPALAKQYGNTTPGDGPKYCGRGYVQLTWKVNYAKMEQLLGVPLTTQPDRAMEPAVAAAVMFEGMTRGDSDVGDFTGKSLENYFNATTDDPRNARRIINGTDKASEIAAIHAQFLDALELADAPPVTPMVVPPVVVKDEPDFSELQPRPAPAPVPAPLPRTEPVVTHDESQLSQHEWSLVQQRLKQLGYYVVGASDGDPADQTRDAIVLFRRRNSLPLKETVDDEFLRKLATAQPLAMPERAEATEKSVTTKVDAMKPTLGTRFWAKIAAIPSAFMAALTGVGEHWQAAKEKLAPVYEWTASVPLWVYFALMGGAAFFIWKKANEASGSMVDDYKKGRTL